MEGSKREISELKSIGQGRDYNKYSVWERKRECVCVWLCSSLSRWRIFTCLKCLTSKIWTLIIRATSHKSSYSFMKKKTLGEDATIAIIFIHLQTFSLHVAPSPLNLPSVHSVFNLMLILHIPLNRAANAIITLTNLISHILLIKQRQMSMHHNVNGFPDISIQRRCSEGREGGEVSKAFNRS